MGIGSKQIRPLSDLVANWAPHFLGPSLPLFGKLGPVKSGHGKLGPLKMLVWQIKPWQIGPWQIGRVEKNWKSFLIFAIRRRIMMIILLITKQDVDDQVDGDHDEDEYGDRDGDHRGRSLVGPVLSRFWSRKREEGGGRVQQWEIRHKNKWWTGLDESKSTELLYLATGGQ